MNKECAIVKDLAPLYVEGLTRQETNQFIEEHLAQCKDCCSEIDELRRPVPVPASEDITPLKKANQYLQRRQSLTILATSLIVAILFILLGAFLTTPEYLSTEAAIINIAGSTSANRIQVVFSEQVSDYRLDGPFEQDGIEVYEITAWTTPWHQLFDSGKRNLSLRIDYDSNISPAVCYNSNNGEAAIQLHGTPLPSCGMIVLPRLTLNYYALAAAALLILAAILYFPLRSHRILWQKLMLIPLCYLVSHFVILLISPDTYSIARSFCLILLLAMALYGAIHLVSARLRHKNR